MINNCFIIYDKHVDNVQYKNLLCLKIRIDICA